MKYSAVPEEMDEEKMKQFVGKLQDFFLKILDADGIFSFPYKKGSALRRRRNYRARISDACEKNVCFSNHFNFDIVELFDLRVVHRFQS